MEDSVILLIKNIEDITLARQMARKFSKEIGFNTITQTKIITAVSELARNIYLYADQGQITLNEESNSITVGIRILAINMEPIIRDIPKVMEAGFSTSGGLGIGLPGVRALMDEFSIESTYEMGTRINAVKWRK